jgi:hypothetical protein
MLSHFLKKVIHMVHYGLAETPLVKGLSWLWRNIEQKNQVLCQFQIPLSFTIKKICDT